METKFTAQDAELCDAYQKTLPSKPIKKDETNWPDESTPPNFEELQCAEKVGADLEC